jgi:hypothetical protein
MITVFTGRVYISSASLTKFNACCIKFMGDVFDVDVLLAIYSVCVCFYTKRTSHVAS